MNYMDYKGMDDNELVTILLKIRITANSLMDQITDLRSSDSGYPWRDKRNTIVAEYSLLKKQLKEIYHYTQLGKNEKLIGSFYSSYFCPAIMDCYLHCNAKSNGTDLEKLFSSLYDISDYILYYLPESKTI